MRANKDFRTLRLLVWVYCRHHEGLPTITQPYRRLLHYAEHRLQHCRYGKDKPACKYCPVHCYAPQQRQKIRDIMRWAGPRMLFYAPIPTFRHFFLHK